MMIIPLQFFKISKLLHLNGIIPARYRLGIPVDRIPLYSVGVNGSVCVQQLSDKLPTRGCLLLLLHYIRQFVDAVLCRYIIFTSFCLQCAHRKQQKSTYLRTSSMQMFILLSIRFTDLINSVKHILITFESIFYT